MKKLVKKIISIASVAAMSFNVGTISLCADEVQDNLHEGEFDFKIEEIKIDEEIPELPDNTFEQGIFYEDTLDLADNYYNSSQLSSINSNTSSSLPAKVDNSTSKFFPPTLNQGNGKTCGSIATTYYQFTYEANKLNNIATNSNNAYSPRFTYNYVNGYDESNYDIMRKFGCVKMSEFPYYDSNGSVNTQEWCTNTTALKNALKTRIKTVNAYSIANSAYNTVITSPNSSELSAIKQLLANGKILTVNGYSYWNSKPGVVSGESGSRYIAYRCYSGGGHTMTVVGYDDNAYCDVNGDGIIQACEKGAFKIANSWGGANDATFSNNGMYVYQGYVWVLYDALNGVSANQVNNWESSLPGNRVSAFWHDNMFYSIDVENKDVNFIGELKFNTSDKFKTNVSIGLSAVSKNSPNSVNSLLTPKTTDDIAAIPFNGVLYFDYNINNNSIPNYCTNKKWYIKCNNNSNMNSVSYKILDDKNNCIKNFGNINNSSSYSNRQIDLVKGDVNYSYSLTSDDANIILGYVVGNSDFSRVQKYLADYNGDGVIDSSDALELLNTINGGN